MLGLLLLFFGRELVGFSWSLHGVIRGTSAVKASKFAGGQLEMAAACALERSPYYIICRHL